MSVFQIVAALVRSFLAEHAELAAENLALRQQPSILQQKSKSWTSPANSETANPARNHLAVGGTRVPCVRAHSWLAPALRSWQFSWHSRNFGHDLQVQ
jgi:hypothetical protein